ncbi:MAG: hypothetical protein ACXVHW_00945 [Methanobacterium sp.]
MPDFGEEYLKLTLEINKHLEGYVDSYFGPSDLKIKVENTPKTPINILNENLNDLHDLLPEDKERGAYLKKVLRAMENTLKILSGENLNFKGEIRAIYDIEPVLMRDKEIQKVRDTLNELLPGSNHQDDLNKRLH